MLCAHVAAASAHSAGWIVGRQTSSAALMQPLGAQA
jgi:hypothetical protein